MQAQQELIHFIGQKIGLSNLALDDAMQATISFDQDLVLTFLAEEGEELSVVSYVMDYEGAQEKVAKQLLTYNFLPPALGGGKLALDPIEQTIILTRTWDASTTDGEMLYGEVEMFVNAVSAIRQDIARILSGDAGQDSANLIPNTLMMHGQMA